MVSGFDKIFEGSLLDLALESIANRRFRDLDELEKVQVQRCVGLQNQSGAIRSLTHFH